MYLTIFGKPRYLGLIVPEDESEFAKGERILIESSRGIEIAVVAGKINERQEGLYRSIDNRQESQSSSDSGLQNVTFLSRVSEADLVRDEENRYDEDGALITARQVLSHHNLDMKLVDVEFMHDRKKLFLYFTSEQRVDFRAYVRDLAREFRTRIELRQIGVRDESKVVKGLGACGRVCCCSYWLQKFMPIGIKMVKEQNLALNPTKISGLCGRLMCCMGFEQDNYRDLWKKLPSHGAKIKTEQGTWILTGVDLATKSCTIHGPDGNTSVRVELFQKFKETILAGKAWNSGEFALQESNSSQKDVQTVCGNCQNCDNLNSTLSNNQGCEGEITNVQSQRTQGRSSRLRRGSSPSAFHKETLNRVSGQRQELESSRRGEGKKFREGERRSNSNSSRDGAQDRKGNSKHDAERPTSDSVSPRRRGIPPAGSRQLPNETLKNASSLNGEE